MLPCMNSLLVLVVKSALFTGQICLLNEEFWDLYLKRHCSRQDLGLDG